MKKWDKWTTLLTELESLKEKLGSFKTTSSIKSRPLKVSLNNIGPKSGRYPKYTNHFTSLGYLCYSEQTDRRKLWTNFFDTKDLLLELPSNIAVDIWLQESRSSCFLDSLVCGLQAAVFFLRGEKEKRKTSGPQTPWSTQQPQTSKEHGLFLCLI